MGVNNMIKGTTVTFTAIMVLGIVGLVTLIIFGNLQGNLGFAAGTSGAVDTNNVIANITGGVTEFFDFATTWFVLLGVALLVIIAFSLVGVVQSRGGGGGFSS